MATDDVLGTMATKLAEMSRQQKRLAGYIMDHLEEAAFLNTPQLAERVGVSKATVVRFATFLGYPSFGDFQRALANQVQRRLTWLDRIQGDEWQDSSFLERSLRQDVANIESVLSERNIRSFPAATQVVAGARRLLIIGGGAPFGVAQTTWAYFSQFMSPVQLITGSGENFPEEMGRVGPGDVFLAFSFQRYNRRTIQILEYAHQRGARCVLIADSLGCPAVPHAEVTLLCSVRGVSFPDSLVAPLAIASALAAAVAALRPTESREALQEWNAAVQHFGLRLHRYFET